MSTRNKKRAQATAGKREQHLLWLTASVTAIKLLVIVTIDNGAWLGADGENYTGQVESLWKGGLFVEGLN